MPLSDRRCFQFRLFPETYGGAIGMPICSPRPMLNKILMMVALSQLRADVVLKLPRPVQFNSTDGKITSEHLKRW